MPTEDDNRTTFHSWRDFSDSLHHVRSVQRSRMEESEVPETVLRGYPTGTRGSTLVMDEGEEIPLEFPIPPLRPSLREEHASAIPETGDVSERMARFQRTYRGNTNTYMLGEDEMSINGFKVVETIKLLQKKVAEQDAYIKLLLKDEEPV